MNLGRACQDPKIYGLLQGRQLVEALKVISPDFGFQIYRDKKKKGYWYVKGDGRNVDVDMHAGDDEGRFSMTGARPANIMAKYLGTYYEETTGFAASSGCCFDLTAGIGGDTIALARVFGTVYAYEINEARCVHLRNNIKNHSVSANIDVRCADSAQELGNKKLKTEDPLPAAFIDPPWGGVHYKRYGRGALVCLPHLL
jgi:hypothetical protein